MQTYDPAIYALGHLLWDRRAGLLSGGFSAVYDVLQTFDFADPSTLEGNRSTTTVTPQALFMMNSPFVIAQAKALASRPDLAQEGEPSKRVEKMYRLLYGRAPTPDEIRAHPEVRRAYLGDEVPA